jgi:hypothetical protein
MLYIRLKSYFLIQKLTKRQCLDRKTIRMFEAINKIIKFIGRDGV